MVTSLDRKLLRDLVQLKGQVATIALVVAAGIACLVSALSTYGSLTSAQRSYYAESRFADLFVELKRAPTSLLARIGEISGVAQIESRLAFDVILEVPGNPEPTNARLVSIPDGKTPPLNRLNLRSGRLPDFERNDEVLISEGFAKANHLKPGEQFKAILNGRLRSLQIVGIALSPEYVYALRGQTPLPDDRHFGVIWMNRTGAEAAFNMSGAFNSASLILAPGANKRNVMEVVDQLLLPYGSFGVFDRRQQLSHRYLSDEIAQQKVMAFTLPIIFLSVAMFLLNTVINRLASTQRQQIATLKAVGYSDFTIAFHYLKLVAVIVAIGTVIGTILGSALGSLITDTYRGYFRFPALPYRISPLLALSGFAMSLASAVAGTLMAILAIAKLPPAEAMRPSAPLAYRVGLLERFAFARNLAPEWKIGIRSMTQRPFRFFLTLIGISMAVGIVVVGIFWKDTIDAIISYQFHEAERGEIAIGFANPEGVAVLSELRHIPGVLKAEGTRAVSARIRNAQYTYDTGLIGIPQATDLRRLLDQRFQPIALPPHGVLLSSALAKTLHVRAGDSIEIEVREQNRPKLPVQVFGVVNDLIGSFAYMDRSELNALLSESPSLSSASLLVDSNQSLELYRKLRELPGINSIATKSGMVKTFRETMARIVLVFSLVLTAFAMMISIGVVYNNARIAFSERAWDFASLRVLGFTRAEISRLLLGELAFEVLVSLPTGLIFGYSLSKLAVALLHTETFAFPLVITRATYGVAAAVTLAAATFAAAIVRRRIDGLDLVSVLKARE